MKIGGYVPDFRVRLNVNPISFNIINSLQSGFSEGTLLDSTYYEEIITGATYGSRYNVEVVPEIYVPNGISPSMSLRTDNSGISSLDINNNLNYVSGGGFNIIASYPINHPYRHREERQFLTNFITGGAVTTKNYYEVSPVNVSKNILVVYNSSSSDSVNLKNHYTGTRPTFSGANTLGITCITGENALYSEYTGTIRQPIVNWITGNPSKLIRYIVMMQDIPSTVSNLTGLSYLLSQSLSDLNIRTGTKYQNQNNRFSLYGFQGTTCLISYINFGSYNDSAQYINRISSNQTGIFLTGNGQNTGYYLEDASAPVSPTWVSGRHLKSLLSEFPTIKYNYRSSSGAYITTGNGVAGFCTWGGNGGRGATYANDGSIKWGGPNNWYLMATVESYNGQRAIANQGNFIDWFSSGAFNGTGYNNCPVGAVCHVQEPFLQGTQNTGYFQLWERGWPFIECAWQSRLTNHLLVCGDPLVCK